MAAEFTDLIDLASERVGGVALVANDDFFAEKENLLRPHAAVWKEHEYTDKGKWMDGWETRRRRDPDWAGTGAGTPQERGKAIHDWCVIRLGLPGIVRGVVIDTAFFRGNFPESASIEAAEMSANTDLAAQAAAKWEELLPRSPLKGDSKNLFAIKKPRRATHLRLNIFPDGGVARLRVHGNVVPDWDRLTAIGGPVDLAAAENGGSVLVCSDMFFGSRHNLVLPGRPPNMSEGWETKRRRGAGNDWTIVELGSRGSLRKIEVDTTHFRGNAPGKILIEGLDKAGAPVDALTAPKTGWRTLLRLTGAQPHTRHFFEDELRAIGPVTHVRLSVFPCGGIARLRAWGDVAERELRSGIAKLNALPRAEAVSALKAVCGSKAWAESMAERRPFEDLPSLQRIAERVWWELSEKDWLEAFSAHPRIGDKASGAAGKEQAGVAGASDAVKSALAKKNAEYEKKFAFVYLVCATGKSADEMLGILNERLDSTRERELQTAAEEQAMITRLRLRKLVNA